MDVLDLWLMRHGETDWNRERRIQGQTDVPLNARGIAQAKRLAQRFSIRRFDAVYTSDSERAHHTAKLTLPGCSIHLDRRLREIHFGTLEGKTRAELSEEERRAYGAYRKGVADSRLPHGESQRDVRSRVDAWLQTLPTRGQVAAFTHGGTIRALVLSVLNASQSEHWHLVFSNTGVTRLQLEPGRTLVRTLNDTAHLEELGEHRV